MFNLPITGLSRTIHHSRKRRLILAMALCIGWMLGPGFAVAKAPVWKISKDGFHLYLGGTVHVLSESDYPLPEEFDKAFNNSDVIVFEADVAAMSLPEVQSKMLAIMMYQDQRTLSSVLDKQLYHKLEIFLAERQIPIANFEKFTPAGVSLSLTVIEMQRFGLMDTAGVDVYYSKLAKDVGKSISTLESIDEQINFLGGMNDIDPNQLIASSMDDLQDFQSTWKSMLGAWRTGNTQALRDLTLVPMRTDYPQLYRTLLVDRNNAWLKKIKRMLSSREVEFMLVGFLHMVGVDGLITQLKDEGYQVQQY